MDNPTELFTVGNLVIGVIALFLLFVVFKILKSLGKGLLILGALVAIGFAVNHFFPNVVEPVREFIGGSWLEPAPKDGPF